MTGRYLTDLADVCRASGLVVVEWAGWQTRARSSGGYGAGLPWAVFWHHTASQTTPANDVNFIINAQDGPLSNLYLARDGAVHVIAAGATNTNGKGGPLQMSRGTIPVDGANVRVIGVEAANSGVGETWPQAQIDAYFTLNNALCAAYGLEPTDCATHAQWSPGRKIDPATAAAVAGPWRPRSINSAGTWDPGDVRAEARARADPAPTPPDQGGQLVFTMFDCLGNTYGGYLDANGIIAQVTWLSPTRMAACASAGAEHIGELSPADLGNCDLLGPIPTGTPRDTFANVIGG